MCYFIVYKRQNTYLYKKYLLSDKESMTKDLIKLLITEPVGGINSTCTVEINFFIDKFLWGISHNIFFVAIRNFVIYDYYRYRNFVIFKDKTLGILWFYCNFAHIIYCIKFWLWNYYVEKLINFYYIKREIK